LLPYYTVSSLSGGTWNTSKKQSPFCLVPPLSLSVVQTEKKMKRNEMTRDTYIYTNIYAGGKGERERKKN
jgi:hypothetical protein